MYLIYQEVESSKVVEAVIPVAIVDSSAKAKVYCDFLKKHHGVDFHSMFLPMIDFDSLEILDKITKYTFYKCRFFWTHPFVISIGAGILTQHFHYEMKWESVVSDSCDLEQFEDNGIIKQNLGGFFCEIYVRNMEDYEKKVCELADELLMKYLVENKIPFPPLQHRCPKYRKGQ